MRECDRYPLGGLIVSVQRVSTARAGEHWRAYAMSGVDIDAVNRLVDLIKPITAMTRRAGCAQKGSSVVRRMYAPFR